MKITKRQLRRIIREAVLENPPRWARDQGYDDRTAGKLEPLLPDDDDYMDGWSQAEAEPPFRGPDPATHKRLRQQTRAQGGYSGKGAWKSRTPNE
jgi:hypothetical protein